jgi:hypothetical protein
MRKPFSVIALLFVAIAASSARADTRYSYSGNDYTFCTGTYSDGTPGVCGGTYALSVTLDVNVGTQLDNLPFGTNITPNVSSFSFSDGSGLTITELTDTGGANILIGTDSNGNITSWQLSVFTNTPTILYGLETQSIPSPIDESSIEVLVGGSFQLLNDATSITPGSWSAPVATPEPNIFLLLGTGLLVVGMMISLRKGLPLGNSQQ